MNYNLMMIFSNTPLGPEILANILYKTIMNTLQLISVENYERAVKLGGMCLVTVKDIEYVEYMTNAIIAFDNDIDLIDLLNIIKADLKRLRFGEVNDYQYHLHTIECLLVELQKIKL